MINFIESVKSEVRNILNNAALMSSILSSVVIYFFIYPAPYINNASYNEPVFIVDHDNSVTSRKLIRDIDATPQVLIAGHSDDVEKSKELVSSGKVSGLIIIPENFNKKLLLGESPVLAVSANASYFMIYGNIVSGISSSVKNISSNINIRRMENSGLSSNAAIKQAALFDLKLESAFNPSLNYLDYIVPAAFLLVLGQGVLSSVAMRTSEDINRSLSSVTFRSALRLILVRVTSFSFIYFPIIIFYFGSALWIYDIHTYGQPLQLLLIVYIFLIATILLGMLLGSLVASQQSILLIVLFSSMPMFFMSGLIWPTSAMPEFLQYFSHLFPVTEGLNLVIRFNQMGARLTDMFNVISLLFAQIFFYGVAVMLLLKRK